MDISLIQTIKLHLAEQSSGELRKMLEERDVGQFSEEAFVAAQEALDERGRGECQEPPPQPPPPPAWTPAQHAAAENALLRRQVRLIGAYYYCFAVMGVLLAAVFVQLGRHDDFAAVAVLFAVGFWWLGWSLRRLSPTARVLAILLSMLQLPGFPIGTIIGIYCFDKLTRADHLFGGKGHPGERLAEPRPAEPNAAPDTGRM